MELEISLLIYWYNAKTLWTLAWKKPISTMRMHDGTQERHLCQSHILSLLCGSTRALWYFHVLGHLECQPSDPDSSVQLNSFNIDFPELDPMYRPGCDSEKSIPVSSGVVLEVLGGAPWSPFLPHMQNLSASSKQPLFLLRLLRGGVRPSLSFRQQLCGQKELPIFHLLCGQCFPHNRNFLSQCHSVCSQQVRISNQQNCSHCHLCDRCCSYCFAFDFVFLLSSFPCHHGEDHQRNHQTVSRPKCQEQRWRTKPIPKWAEKPMAACRPSTGELIPRSFPIRSTENSVPTERIPVSPCSRANCFWKCPMIFCYPINFDQ